MANRRRSEQIGKIMQEVAHRDELRKRNFEQSVKKKAAKKTVVRTKTVKPKCCIDKYGDDLPNGFKPCIDCPNSA